MIRSIYDNQDEILDAIKTLHLNGKNYQADITYGNGGFWRKLESPKIKYDIEPLVDGVKKASSCSLPEDDNSLQSIVFDPPFLTYIKNNRNHNSIMGKRFSGYWTYNELESHYKGTLNEAARVLSKKGLLIFKCQDIIHNHKMHCTHINIVNWAKYAGFRLKDLFILQAKSRMAIPQQKNTKKKKQRHARIFHSYFLVLEKQK